MQEEGFYRRALIEAYGKGGNDLQPLCLQRCNGAVVVAGVAGQNVRAHQQQPDTAAALRGLQAWQLARLLRNAGRQSWVIQSQVGIVARRFGRQGTAQTTARTSRVAVDQEANQMHDVVLGPGEPVLQR